MNAVLAPFLQEIGIWPSRANTGSGPPRPELARPCRPGWSAAVRSRMASGPSPPGASREPQPALSIRRDPVTIAAHAEAQAKTLSRVHDGISRSAAGADRRRFGGPGAGIALAPARLAGRPMQRARRRGSAVATVREVGAPCETDMLAFARHDSTVKTLPSSGNASQARDDPAAPVALVIRATGVHAVAPQPCRNAETGRGRRGAAYRRSCRPELRRTRASLLMVPGDLRDIGGAAAPAGRRQPPSRPSGCHRLAFHYPGSWSRPGRVMLRRNKMRLKPRFGEPHSTLSDRESAPRHLRRSAAPPNRALARIAHSG